jgi:hypothetical protein
VLEARDIFGVFFLVPPTLERMSINYSIIMVVESREFERDLLLPIPIRFESDEVEGRRRRQM